MSGVQGQVIGAAARDPKVQAAAGNAVMSPELQAAAWKAAQEANRQSQEAARQTAPAPRESRGGLLSRPTSARRVNCSVRLWCFVVALALFVSSILGMINLFDAAFHPFQYLFAVYNLFFAVAIIIVEGEREWFKRIFDVQGRLFTAVPCLSWRAGRALFYFYIGSINLFLLPESWIWKIIYLCIGGSLCGAGLLKLAERCVDRCTRSREPEQKPHITV